MNNLEIWDKVKTTDQTYTKKGMGGQSGATSINAHYMMMRATETFGPIGIGWGYDVVEEKFVDAEPVYYSAGTERVLEGIGKNHTIKLKLWFKIDGEKGEITDYGHTKYSYKTSGGKWKFDEEVSKKSLTDAIKRCLSKIGFCADIYLGEFDDQNYQAEAYQVTQAEKEAQAIEKDEAKAKIEADKHQGLIDEIHSAENASVLRRAWPLITRKALNMSNGDRRLAVLTKEYDDKLKGFNNETV